MTKNKQQEQTSMKYCVGSPIVGFNYTLHIASNIKKKLNALALN